MSAKSTLKLFLRRNDFRSNLVFSLMNYNKVDFDLFVEHMLSGWHVVKDHYPGVKTLPLLTVEKDKKLFHYEGDIAVMDQLKKMRHLKRGITYSAWETQTCEWLYASVVPPFEVMTSGLTWHFSESYINSGALNARIGDYISGFFTILKDTMMLQWMHRQHWLRRKSAARKEFEKALIEWEARLGSRDFHGDTAPDKADFLMFSLIGCYQMRMKALLKSRVRTQLWRDRLVKLVDQQED